MAPLPLTHNSFPADAGARATTEGEEVRQREGSGWDRWRASAVVALRTEPRPAPSQKHSLQPRALWPVLGPAPPFLVVWHLYGHICGMLRTPCQLLAADSRQTKGLDPKFAKWMGQGRKGCWLWTCYECEETIWTFGSKRKWSSDRPASDLPLPGAVLMKMVPTPGSQANQVRGGCLSGSPCSVNCVQSEPQQTSYYLLYLSVWGLSLNRCWSVGLGICWMSQ